MRDEDDAAGAVSEAGEADRLSTRRAMLRIAALGAVAVVTVKPGMAQATASALTCSVPVPDSNNSGKWIAADGSLVKKNTKGAFAGPSSELKGEDVKNAIKYGTSYPGYSANASSAYTNYIKRLTIGKQGYTCYSSLQSPSRQ